MLGDKDASWGNGGVWIDIDAPAHGGFAKVVWAMEDDVRLDQANPALESTARLLAASFDLVKALRELHRVCVGMDHPDQMQRPEEEEYLAAVAGAEAALQLVDGK